MKQPIFLAIAALLSSGAHLFAQEAQSPPSSSSYVSREEYDKLRSEMDALKAQMAELVKNSKSREPQAPAEGPSDVNANGTKVAKPARSDNDAKVVKSADASGASDVDEVRSEVAKVKEMAEATVPGSTKFLLTGYAFAGFQDRHGETSTFRAGFSPIFLWKLSDKIFFEGELEVGQEDGETTLNLEDAHLTYLLNDYITVGMGKFLTPFGQSIHFHAAWINKLPDFSLVFNDDEGLVGFSQLGAEANGVIPIGPIMVFYDAYVSNGPRLNTTDPAKAGVLDFDNFTDTNNNKAVGGRIGFMPLPQLEIGYSILYARVSAPDTSGDHARVLLQGVDASYMRDIDWLKGGIELRGEWVWSKVGRLTYDPTGDLGFGPVTFNNRREGGYGQMSYRPYKLKVPVIEKLEAVARYDTIDTPRDAPGAFDEERWSIGLNYWLGQSTVIKAAYEFGNRRSLDNGRENVDSFLLQAAMGF